MDAQRDPLSRLVGDDIEADRELLARVLEGKVRIDVSKGTFRFLSGAKAGTNSRKQVITALLAQKAVHLLKNEFGEGMHPREIEAVTGIRGGTLRPLLKVLLEQRIVGHDAAKAYVIPNYAVEDAAKLLSIDAEKAS